MMSKPTPNSGNSSSDSSSREILAEPVVFFGTGPVAAKSLELLAQWATVEAVITKPKPPHHKGDFPVLDVANKLNLPILSVTDKQSLDTLMLGRPVHSRLGVLVDFGIIVSQTVIDYFPLGIINSHFSLLPEWRGADPITFSILSGQPQTGVSLMLLVEKMDEGPLLAFGVQEIGTMTTPELTQRLIALSDGLMRTELPRYASGHTKLIVQDDIHTLLDRYPSEPSYSRKLTKQDGALDPRHKSAEQLEREVRAYLEWPKSYITIGTIDAIVTQAHVINGKGAPGTIYHAGKDLGFYTTSGIFMIDSLRPAGKQEMSAAAFLNGYGKDLS